MELKLHPCQKFPDDEYWIYQGSGLWKVKLKEDFKGIVMRCVMRIKFGHLFK